MQSELAPCKVGDRIRLIHMPDDPNPIEPGDEGTVNHIHEFRGGVNGSQTHIGVSWDSGRSLALIHPVDSFEVIS